MGGLQLAKVFVVEDSAVMIELLRELLQNVGGLEVIGFSSTEAEAMLWLGENPGRWDIVVLDLILEQGSGLGLAAHAQRSNPAGKTVVFSSYVSPAIRSHCLKLGAAAVFDKTESAKFIDWLAANR